MAKGTKNLYLCSNCIGLACGCISCLLIHYAFVNCVNFTGPTKELKKKKINRRQFSNLLNYSITVANLPGLSLYCFIALRCEAVLGWTPFTGTNIVGICPKTSINTSSFLEKESPAALQVRRADTLKVVNHSRISIHASTVARINSVGLCRHSSMSNWGYGITCS